MSSQAESMSAVVRRLQELISSEPNRVKVSGSSSRQIRRVPPSPEFRKNLPLFPATRQSSKTKSAVVDPFPMDDGDFVDF